MCEIYKSFPTSSFCVYKTPFKWDRNPVFVSDLDISSPPFAFAEKKKKDSLSVKEKVKEKLKEKDRPVNESLPQ